MRHDGIHVIPEDIIPEDIQSNPPSPPSCHLPMILPQRCRPEATNLAALQISRPPIHHVPMRQPTCRPNGQRPSLVVVSPTKRMRARVDPPTPTAQTVPSLTEPHAAKQPPDLSSSPACNDLRCILGEGLNDTLLQNLLSEADGSVNIAANTYLNMMGSVPTTPRTQPKRSVPPPRTLKPLLAARPFSGGSLLSDDGAGVFTPITRSLFTPKALFPPKATASPAPSPFDEPELDSTSTWIPPELLSHLASEHTGSGFSQGLSVLSSCSAGTVRSSLSASMISSGSMERAWSKTSGSAASKRSVTR